MIEILKSNPELLIEYTDPIEGFKGWLAIDSLVHQICAGGLRVQKGLSKECIIDLAATMSLKMRISGIRADGAKSGIDYDPNSPGKKEALLRFIKAIRPYVMERYSMGPDLNTKMDELDEVTSKLAIPSIKMAVARAQGLPLPSFLDRYKVLDQTVGFSRLGNLRSGFGLSSACLGAMEFLNIEYPDAKVSIQGFGGLGAAAAYSLFSSSVNIIAISDHEKCLISTDGKSLDINLLVQESKNGLIPQVETNGVYLDRDAIYDVNCDVFVPAAIENVITSDNALDLPYRAIVCGANLAISLEAEKLLNDRGVIVIPDLVAGAGGSLSMDGLFGPAETPTALDVLDHVDQKMRFIVQRVLRRCREDNLTPRDAALIICEEAELYPDAKPYGPLI